MSGGLQRRSLLAECSSLQGHSAPGEAGLELGGGTVDARHRLRHGHRVAAPLGARTREHDHHAHVLVEVTRLHELLDTGHGESGADLGQMPSVPRLRAAATAASSDTGTAVPPDLRTASTARALARLSLMEAATEGFGERRTEVPAWSEAAMVAEPTGWQAIIRGMRWMMPSSWRSRKPFQVP